MSFTELSQFSDSAKEYPQSSSLHFPYTPAHTFPYQNISYYRQPRTTCTKQTDRQSIQKVVILAIINNSYQL